MTAQSKPRTSWFILGGGLLVILPLLFILARGFSFNPRQINSPLIDQPAPSFELPRLTDSSRLVTVESLRGKPVVLNFWATWCVSCPREHPWLVRLARKFGDDVQFVGVAYEERNEAIQAWLDRNGGGAYPTLVDINGKAAIAFGVYGVPETYVIDAEGVIRHKHTGPIHVDRLVDQLEELL